jgi:hypothetical protein
MDAIEDVNWSEICWPAFEVAVATSENPSMETIIERLRAEKLADAQRDQLEGKAAGRE